MRKVPLERSDTDVGLRIDGVEACKELRYKSTRDSLSSLLNCGPSPERLIVNTTHRKKQS